jgi:hypothetical protein
MEIQSMTEDECAWMLNELDRLLNDPDVPLRPGLIWRLVPTISGARVTAEPAEMPWISPLERRWSCVALHRFWVLVDKVSEQDLPGGTMLSQIVASGGDNTHADVQRAVNGRPKG